MSFVLREEQIIRAIDSSAIKDDVKAYVITEFKVTLSSPDISYAVKLTTDVDVG